MANTTKDLDYGAIAAVIVVCAIAFTGVGAFYVAPKLEARRLKKLAAAKQKPSIPNKKA